VSAAPDRPALSPTSSPLITGQPQLLRVHTAARALDLRRYELLHAGPPLADPRQPPQTLRSSIVMSCVHEGWAASETEAESLLNSGALSLSPAQDRGCVTPLAAIVSPGTPLFVVGEPGSETVAAHAPVSAVRGVDTRMGLRDAAVLDRLRYRDTVTAPALQRRLDVQGPLALWPLAARGLAAGDDLHGSTQHANQVLSDVLRAGGAGTLADDVGATPLFFLTLWMAACAWLLRSAEGHAPATLVTRAGGNGEVFAIALAGRPERWVGCTASAPVGPRLPNVAAEVPVEGAIGDSAVIDMLGLGGQRLAHAPALWALFRPWLATPPAAPADDPERLLVWPHPGLADAWSLGLDAARVDSLQQAPRVMLAMLGRDGRSGLCGRGVYRPPLDLFARALRMD
jgi:hypothetical protein